MIKRSINDDSVSKYIKYDNSIIRPVNNTKTLNKEKVYLKRIDLVNFEVYYDSSVPAEKWFLCESTTTHNLCYSNFPNYDFKELYSILYETLKVSSDKKHYKDILTKLDVDIYNTVNDRRRTSATRRVITLTEIIYNICLNYNKQHFRKNKIKKLFS